MCDNLRRYYFHKKIINIIIKQGKSCKNEKEDRPLNECKKSLFPEKKNTYVVGKPI